MFSVKIALIFIPSIKDGGVYLIYVVSFVLSEYVDPLYTNMLSIKKLNLFWFVLI